jgi:hypothetical protein
MMKGTLQLQPMTKPIRILPIESKGVCCRFSGFDILVDVVEFAMFVVGAVGVDVVDNVVAGVAAVVHLVITDNHS